MGFWEEQYPSEPVDFYGLTIRYELPPRSTQPAGVQYGYFEGIPASDGDDLDVLVGEADMASDVYICEQMHSETGELQQYKVCVAFPDQEEAERACDTMWPGQMGATKGMSVVEFLNMIDAEDD